MSEEDKWDSEISLEYCQSKRKIEYTNQISSKNV